MMRVVVKINLSPFLVLLMGVLQLGLVACATGGGMVFHSFEFNTHYDEQDDVEVLDYQYGGSGQFGTHPEKERVQRGEWFARTSIHGVMPRGEFLYVKWRLKGSGKIYEDKVDLKSRLPADISEHRIYFLIRESQLYVYLISPELRSPSEPAGPVEIYSSYKKRQIYPDQLK